MRSSLDFHNPLGASLTLAKRQQVAAVAARTGVPLVEDDPYSPLRYAGQTLPPIKAFTPGVNFSAEGRGPNTLRLNNSNNTPDRIADGVRRLGMVPREMARA